MLFHIRSLDTKVEKAKKREATIFGQIQTLQTQLTEMQEKLADLEINKSEAESEKDRIATIMAGSGDDQQGAGAADAKMEQPTPQGTRPESSMSSQELVLMQQKEAQRADRCRRCPLQTAFETYRGRVTK